MFGPKWGIQEGDALQLLRGLPAEHVDLILTDPPYSSGGLYRGDRAKPTGAKYNRENGHRWHDFPGDARDQRSWLLWSTLWLTEALRASKPGAPLLMFIDWRQIAVATDAVQAAGWLLRGILPWDKTEAGSRPVRGGFRAQAEFVLWASSGPTPKDRRQGFAPGCFRMPAPRGAERRHQTGKPVALLEQLLAFTQPRDLVLDPFAGSGSSGVAALRKDCDFMGFEVVPAYAAVARERCAAALEVR